ncbi:hypothetical protein Pan241w_18730 [Gimesia alba]|uniref:HMA domain-containing protein n=1 Tax=Gimesia alba TaxID=2527973 RepID=A0A517RD52_9PLAN|nr:hypothetical protein [Gimesia alba]QDT41809.1 hypothetical protein Pan241w_18730 [Gimesia alba]
MISHLIKICLSLMLAASLMVPRTWCCADSGQTTPKPNATQHSCCSPQSAQQTQSSEPLVPVHNCSCCAAKVIANVAKTTKVDPNQTSLHQIDVTPELIPPGNETSLSYQGSLPRSRPLHLLHCVWTC